MPPRKRQRSAAAPPRVIFRRAMRQARQGSSWGCSWFWTRRRHGCGCRGRRRLTQRFQLLGGGIHDQVQNPRKYVVCVVAADIYHTRLCKILGENVDGAFERNVVQRVEDFVDEDPGSLVND